MKALSVTFLILVLSRCSWSTGPEVVAGPVSLSLLANTSGEVYLAGAASIPLISSGFMGLNWSVAFEKTLIEAQDTSFFLYLLWETPDGEVYRDVYEVGDEFEIELSRSDWVRKISTDTNRNVVVFIERERVVEYYRRSQPQPQGQSCNNVFPNRLMVGGQAEVIVYQVSVRSEPSLSSSLVENKYFKEGRVLEVINGPECSNGWLWWEVYSQELGFGGWVVEADDENYFLAP